MENKNISYRRLRDPKRGKVGTTSESLLIKKSCQHRATSAEEKKKEFSIMTQNVTRYQHMLKQSHIKQNYIDWIVKLRQPIILDSKKSQDAIVSVPSCYNKSTESRQNYLKTKQEQLPRAFNSADFVQIFSRKNARQHLQGNTLLYMTNLRQQSLKISKQSTEKPQFNNLPLKDKKQLPMLLSKDAMKKTKSITRSQKVSALDGSNNFPPYTHKIVREKNFGLLCTFTNGKNKVSMPTMAWQMGLRN